MPRSSPKERERAAVAKAVAEAVKKERERIGVTQEEAQRAFNLGRIAGLRDIRSEVHKHFGERNPFGPTAVWQDGKTFLVRGCLPEQVLPKRDLLALLWARGREAGAAHYYATLGQLAEERDTAQ